MANWTSFIVYFKATEPVAALNINDGAWVRAVADAAEGATYIANIDNQNLATVNYGTGELMVSTDVVSIPHTAIPGAAWYNDSNNTMQTTRLRLFPLRDALRAFHDRLEFLYDVSVRVGPNHPPEHVTFVQRILFGMHQGAWYVWNDTDLRLKINQFLTLSAMGPADPGTQSFVQLGSRGGGTSYDLTISMPIGVAPADVGNGWVLQLSRAGGADPNSVSVDSDARVISLVLAGTQNYQQVHDFLISTDTFSAEDIALDTAGAARDLGPPPSGSTNYTFTGGVSHYDPANPETIADIVDTMGDLSGLNTETISLVNLSGDVVIRRTLAESLDINNTLGDPPTVAQLDRGNWINGVNA